MMKRHHVEGFSTSANNLMLRWEPPPGVRYLPSQTPIGYVVRLKLGPPAKRPPPIQ